MSNEIDLENHPCEGEGKIEIPTARLAGFPKLSKTSSFGPAHQDIAQLEVATGESDMGISIADGPKTTRVGSSQSPSESLEDMA